MVNIIIMARVIKSIPTLEDKAAKAFMKKARASEKKRGTIDFSRQYQMAHNILKKAKL